LLAVGLGLAHLLAQRLRMHAEIVRDVRDRPLTLERDPNRSLHELVGIFLRSSHGSGSLSARTASWLQGLRQTRDGSAQPTGSAYTSTHISLNGSVRCHLVTAPLGSEAMSPGPRSSVGPFLDLDPRAGFEHEEDLRLRQHPRWRLRIGVRREAAQPGPHGAGVDEHMLLGTASDLGIGLPFLCRSAGNENAWVDLHRALLAAQVQRAGAAGPSPAQPTAGLASRIIAPSSLRYRFARWLLRNSHRETEQCRP